MIWPFKRAPRRTLEEAFAHLPMPPCGDRTQHYHWTKLQGLPCPSCRAHEEVVRKARAEDQLAEKIAAAVVRHIEQRTSGGDHE